MLKRGIAGCVYPSVVYRRIAIYITAAAFEKATTVVGLYRFSHEIRMTLNCRNNDFMSTRNMREFESGEHRSGGKRRKNFFWSRPSTFLALEVQLVVLVSSFVMFGQFLVCCFSTHSAPVPSHW